MNGDQGVIGYLNKALRHELTAVNQYWLHYRLLDNDLQAELSARSLYTEAATHCHSVADYVTRDLFEQLIHDEERHIDFLETQIDLVARIGLELYAQRQIGENDEN